MGSGNRPCPCSVRSTARTVRSEYLSHNILCTAGARPWVEIVPGDGMSATLKGYRGCSKRVSKKSVCNPEQRRRVWGSGERTLLPGGRRFFDFAQNDIYFAQNDSCFAQNDSCFARNDIFYTMPRRPFLDTL